jgi:DNA-binding response OmpR family regulator
MSNSEKRVLVVEDDRGISFVLSLALREAGLNVRTAATGQQALDLLCDESEDAVVLDLGLPDGKGGAVLQWLRSHNGSGPVWVVISALNKEDAQSQYGPIGPNFLAKPFDPWLLISRVEQLLSEKSAQTI